MRSRILLKIIGVTSLLAMYIFIAISLNSEMAKRGSNFAFPWRAEQRGWCDPLFETDIYPPPPNSITAIHVYFVQETSFVLDKNTANYPEVTPITVIAVQKNADNTFELYKGNELLPAITMKVWEGNPELAKLIKDFNPPYQLVNLNGNISSWLTELPSFNASSGEPNWPGLFYLLKDASYLEGALNSGDTSNGNPALDNSLEISMGAGSQIGLIAVKTWNYREGISAIQFDIKSSVETLNGIPIKIYGVTKFHGVDVSLEGIMIVDLNIDNVNIIRERSDESDPGLFIVEGAVDSNGKERTYSDIVQILMDSAKSNVLLPRGGGLDWLEVAAADIYNNPPNDNVRKVFRCVKEIFAEFLMVDRRPVFGLSSRYLPVVWLNPYYKEHRFNLQVSDGYSFTSYKGRNATIYHEALHCYAHRFGEGVYDNDNDGLIVGTRAPDNGRNIYFNFCWDSGKDKRNFIRLDNTKKGLTMQRYLHAFSGDDDGIFGPLDHPVTYFGGYYSIFDTPVDYSLESFFTDMPRDLPCGALIDAHIFPLFFYNINNGKEVDMQRDLQKRWTGSLTIKEVPLDDIVKNYGKYTPSSHYIECTTPVLSKKIKETLDQIKKEYGFEAWTLYSFTYKEVPEEYDAAYFSITQGE